MQAFAQGAPVFALKVDQPVRDMVFVEKIVELVAVSRTVLRENAQPGKLAVALQPLPTHDERAHDRLADAGQFRERLAKPVCGHFQNFALIRFASRIGQRRGAHEHRNVPDETARACSREDLLLPVARLEDFQLAAQDHRQARDHAGLLCIPVRRAARCGARQGAPAWRVAGHRASERLCSPYRGRIARLCQVRS